MADARPIRRLEGSWSEIVLVCGRCSKKLAGGFGQDGDERLAKTLRRELGGKRKLRPAKKAGGRVAVLETGCLGLCPKDAVVAMRPGERGQLLVVPRGQDPAAVALALGFTTADA